MDATFRELVEALDQKFQLLIRSRAVRCVQLPRAMPERGVYLFSEGDDHLYVGRTNRMRQRLQSHCRPSSGHVAATFAFRLARLGTGRVKASYVPHGSRSHLVEDPVFGPAFHAAKARVANMDIRFVEEDVPTRQALLEIYTATVLRTPYNDFDNH